MKKSQHTIISGGEELLGFAKSRLSALNQALGPNAYSSQVYYPQGADGPMVRVQVTPVADYIFIDGATDVMLSGMVDQGSIITVSGKKTMYRFYPSVEQAYSEVISRDFRNEKALAITADPAIDLPSAGDPYAQAGVIAPAMFTGQMVKAVQVVMGIKGRRAHYDWRILKTHGIMKDNAGKPWLIEISLDNGVLAMRLPTISKLSGKNKGYASTVIKNSLGYIPSGAGFPPNSKLVAAIASGAVRRLMMPSGLNSFYAKAAFYMDCGWAFSENGYEAQNTVWSWPDDYKRGHRYKVSIARNGSGEPVSASINEVESGYLYNWPLKECRFYVPAESNGFKIASFDMAKFGAMVGPRPASAWIAPLFVYYDGDDEQVVRQVATNGSFYDVSSPSQIVGADSTAVQNYNEGNNDVGGSFNPTTGFSGPDIVPDESYSASTRENIRHVVVPRGTYGVEDRNNETSYTFEFHTGYEQKTTYTNLNKSKKTSIAISPRNRSAFFIACNQTDIWASALYVTQSGPEGPFRGGSSTVYGYTGTPSIGTFQVVGSAGNTDTSYPNSGVNGHYRPFTDPNGNVIYWDYGIDAYFGYFQALDASWAGGAPNPYHSQIGGVYSSSASYPPPTSLYPPNSPGAGYIIPNGSTSYPGGGSSINTLIIRNGSNSIPITPGANFGLFYEVSPALGGTYALLNSGYSAFSGNLFQSPDINLIDGSDLNFSGNYPIGSCQPRISFVGID